MTFLEWASEPDGTNAVIEQKACSLVNLDLLGK